MSNSFSTDWSHDSQKALLLLQHIYHNTNRDSWYWQELYLAQILGTDKEKIVSFLTSCIIDPAKLKENLDRIKVAIAVVLSNKK